MSGCIPVKRDSTEEAGFSDGHALECNSSAPISLLSDLTL